MAMYGLVLMCSDTVLAGVCGFLLLAWGLAGVVVLTTAHTAHTATLTAPAVAAVALKVTPMNVSTIACTVVAGAVVAGMRMIMVSVHAVQPFPTQHIGPVLLKSTCCKSSASCVSPSSKGHSFNWRALLYHAGTLCCEAMQHLRHGGTGGIPCSTGHHSGGLLSTFGSTRGPSLFRGRRSMCAVLEGT